MLKKREFWIGFIAGGIVIFFYAWLSIWTTYTALERQNREREAELKQVKHSIYYIGDILSQGEEIIEWNRQTTLPVPEWVVGEEGQ